MNRLSKPGVAVMVRTNVVARIHHSASSMTVHSPKFGALISIYAGEVAGIRAGLIATATSNITQRH
jgi:ribose 5-phosphate isomerase RpiB